MRATLAWSATFLGNGKLATFGMQAASGGLNGATNRKKWVQLERSLDLEKIDQQ